MKAISKARHFHLKQSLLAMEQLMSCLPSDEVSSLQCLGYAEQLDQLFEEYQELLNQLSIRIACYEDLYHEVRVQYLGKKLRQFRKEIDPEEGAIHLLHQNIRLSRGS